MSINKVTVSVIVPIFKVEKYIDRCARSLFAQTYKDIEFIFVNDCSPDNSIVLLSKTIDDYPALKNRIRIIQHEKNRGSSASRNTGIKEALGVFLFFVDADDFVEPNAIELLINKQLETGADIVSGKALRHFKDRIIEMGDRGYDTKEEFVCNLIQYSFDHVLWRRIIKKSLFIEHNIWMKEGVNLAEDWQVITRLAYFAKKIAHIDDYIYNYNSMNENSIIFSQSVKMDENLWRQEEESMRIVKDFFKDKEAVYQKSINRMETIFYYSYLTKSVKARKRDYYNYCLLKLQSEPNTNYNYIGWNNPIRRYIMSRYWIVSILWYIKNSILNYKK